MEITRKAIFISIHSAARAETREQYYRTAFEAAFQSTPPRGRRPLVAQFWARDTQFQSTPPRGRRLKTTNILQSMQRISIHSAARAETPTSNGLTIIGGKFQSTPPRGRRRRPSLVEGGAVHISIHSAARAETCFSQLRGFCTDDFNPLRREGGDNVAGSLAAKVKEFQSTPPRGRRLRLHVQYTKRLGISIHSAARAETSEISMTLTSMISFQSTPPRGRRLI